MIEMMSGNKFAVLLGARGVRLAFMQQQYDSGNLTEEEAKELLRGPLTPGDENTIVDDSAHLTVRPEE